MRRWKDNIKMNIRVTGCEDGDWIELDQYRPQFWVFPESASAPSGFIKGGGGFLELLSKYQILTKIHCYEVT